MNNKAWKFLEKFYKDSDKVSLIQKKALIDLLKETKYMKMVEK